MVKGQDADLLKEVGQQDVVVRLEALLLKTSKRWRGPLGVEDGLDPEKGRCMLGSYASKVGRGSSMHGL